MGKITRAQREALKRVYDRMEEAARPPYREFRRSVQGPFYRNDPCVMVKYGNIWLGVEADGYTHS